MDGDTGVQALANFWKWTEDVCREEFCGKRDQGDCSLNLSGLRGVDHSIVGFRSSCLS